MWISFKSSGSTVFVNVEAISHVFTGPEIRVVMKDGSKLIVDGSGEYIMKALMERIVAGGDCFDVHGRAATLRKWKEEENV
jgi:uncharacterized protein YlzI (FlbEa/FlbD family)